MITININYAYDGFLYAPLFLAHDLGYLPSCSNLKYLKGDSECLDGLCQHSEEGEENWFAICDPFSVDLSTKIPPGDELCVIGCLVDKIPIWLFNQEPSITRVSQEQGLSRYKDKIHKLRCYPNGTTGYLVGRRLMKALELKSSDVEEREFGTEFDGGVPSDTVVATSDILQIVNTNGLDGHNIVFDYVKNSGSDLTPFLFTGILTLKSKVLDENLWSALTLLAGIHKAIALLQEPVLRSEVVVLLRKRFGTHMEAIGVSDKSSQETLIRKATTYAFRTENIYSETLKPEKDGWDNAKRQWETIMSQNYAHAELHSEPIPALLIKKGWRHDYDLRQLMAAGLSSVKSIISTKSIGWRHRLALIFGIFMPIICIGLFVDNIINPTLPWKDNAVWISFSFLTLLVLSISNSSLVWQIFKKGLSGHFVTEMSISVTALGIFLAAISQIK